MLNRVIPHKVKFQFEMPKENADRLEWLAEEGSVTKKEIVSNALTLFEWAIEEVQRGRIIASVDEEHERYKEIVLPLLKLFDAVGRARLDQVSKARPDQEEDEMLQLPSPRNQPITLPGAVAEEHELEENEFRDRTSRAPQSN